MRVSRIFSFAWPILWVASAAATWWAWHLPPVPHLVLPESAATWLDGFSCDGNWLAASVISVPQGSTDDPFRPKSSGVRIWSVITGELQHQLITDGIVFDPFCTGIWAGIRQSGGGEQPDVDLKIEQNTGRLERMQHNLFNEYANRLGIENGTNISWLSTEEFSGLCEPLLNQFNSSDEFGAHAVSKSWVAITQEDRSKKMESGGGRILLWNKTDLGAPHELQIPKVDNYMIRRLNRVEFSSDERFLQGYEWPNRFIWDLRTLPPKLHAQILDRHVLDSKGCERFVIAEKAAAGNPPPPGMFGAQREPYFWGFNNFSDGPASCASPDGKWVCHFCRCTVRRGAFNAWLNRLLRGETPDPEAETNLIRVEDLKRYGPIKGTRRVFFSPDSKFLATQDEYEPRTIKIWNLPPRQPVLAIIACTALLVVTSAIPFLRRFNMRKKAA